MYKDSKNPRKEMNPKEASILITKLINSGINYKNKSKDMPQKYISEAESEILN